MMINLSQSVCGWLIIWYTLYRTLCKLFKCQQAEYMCRIITLIHAILITVGAFYVTFLSGTNPYLNLGFPNTHAQLRIITISLGYFLYDFAWCLYYQTEGPVMLLHHIVSIVFMTICLHLGVSGTEVVATIFGSEITSIFLNIRWLMKEHSYYSNKLQGFLIDLIFIGLFIVVRIGVGGHLVYSVWHSSKSPLLVKVGGSLFFGVNCIFLCQILSFAGYRLNKWRKATSQSPSTANSDGVNVPTHCDDPTFPNSLRQRKIYENASKESLSVGHELITRDSFELQATSLVD